MTTLSRRLVELLDAPVKTSNRRAWANITRPADTDQLSEEQLQAGENTPIGQKNGGDTP